MPIKLSSFKEEFHKDVISLNKKRTELRNKLKVIEETKNDTLQLIESLDNAINAFLKNKGSVYDKNASWKQKIIWTLKTANKVLTIPQIASQLKEAENTSNDLTPTIRLTINRMIDKNELKLYIGVSARGFALTEWYENGQIKDTYHY